MKKLLGITLILVLTFILSACKSANSPKATTNNDTNNIDIDTNIDDVINYNEASLYKKLINDYKIILDFRLSDDFQEKNNEGLTPQISSELRLATTASETISYRWDCMFAELPMSEEGENPNYYGYILYDMNDDDIDELFWVRKDHSIIAIFTIYEEKLVLLDAYWSRYHSTINSHNTLVTHGSSGAADSSKTSLYLKNGKLNESYCLYSKSSYNNGNFTVNFYERTETGTTLLTETDYQKLSIQFDFSTSQFWLNQNIEDLE